MTIKITVFAGLKEFFDPEFEIEVDGGGNVSQISETLIRKNAGSSTILKKCRMAVDSVFVNENHKLKNGEHIYIIPPSSGG